MGEKRTAPEGELTLAFALGALQRLDDPRRVYRDAREWSSAVGVVSDAPPALVQHHAGRVRLNHDFVGGNAGIETGLHAARDRQPSSRYVFVGTTAEHERAAANADWEYLGVEEAAAAAGWVLVTTPLWRRVKRRLFGGRG